MTTTHSRTVKTFSREKFSGSIRLIGGFVPFVAHHRCAGLLHVGFDQTPSSRFRFADVVPISLPQALDGVVNDAFGMNELSWSGHVCLLLSEAYHKRPGEVNRGVLCKPSFSAEGG